MIAEMTGTGSVKLAGGKLVRAKARLDQGTILSVELTGDFFLHPEEKLGEIEALFVHKSIFFDEKQMEDEIAKVAEKLSIEFVGITPESIVRATKLAISDAK